MFSELTMCCDNIMTNLNQIGNPANEKLGGLTLTYLPYDPDSGRQVGLGTIFHELIEEIY